MFGRLARGGKSIDETSSILVHLHALLNTRRGESMVCPEMGLIDFSDVVHRFPESAIELLDDIEKMISRFEPRLRNISVEPVECDDPLRIRFEIHAQLKSKPRHSIHIRTELAADGRFTLDGA
jgi:type VI secretion system protein